jgi:outer membrane lipoprotein-sorting protein
MRNRIVTLVVLFVCWSIGFAGEPNDLAQISSIIENLNQAANQLKNDSAKIEYMHAQPLFDTQTIRTGRLFYVKDANSSALRINFMTMKQDQARQQNYREDYIFDGIKLTKIDYQGKSAATEQLAENKPIEPFELVQDYFPIIGFAEKAGLVEQFDIKLQQKTKKGKFIAVILTPKENSRFFNTYKQVEIKIDSDSFLPFDFSALTCEDEMITIKLFQMDTSTAVKRSMFDIVIPADFVQAQK